MLTMALQGALPQLPGALRTCHICSWELDHREIFVSPGLREWFAGFQKQQTLGAYCVQTLFTSPPYHIIGVIIMPIEKRETEARGC